MSQLAHHAEQLMDAAASALNVNGFVTDTTIVVGRNGQIRVVDEANWPLASMASAYGALAAYRISNGLGGLRVEGRADGLSCVLRSTPPGAAGRLLLGWTAESGSARRPGVRSPQQC